MKKGLSLVEVLVATVIIAGAIYGMMLMLSAQELAETRMRETRIVKYLHSQLVREIVKGERAANEFSGSDQLGNPALGSTPVTFNLTQNGDTLKTWSNWTGASTVTRAYTLQVLSPNRVVNGSLGQP